MNRIVSVALAFVLVLTAAAVADENPPLRPLTGGALHYIVTTDRVMRPGELEAEGVEVQHVLPGHRYIVRAENAGALRANTDIVSVEAYGLRSKLSREGLRSAASSSPFVTINVLFHDDTTFEAARSAVEAAGGTIETPFTVAYDAPQRLQIRIPPAGVSKLAKNEAVFGVYGRPLRAVAINTQAADLSHVTPLFSAPYGLDGTGIVVSQFEPDDGSGNGVDTTHPEFSGRATTHNVTKVGRHATHVAGTMIAVGLTAGAKGMAPNATLQEFGLPNDVASFFSDKKGLAQFGVTSDNNSWGFVTGWQEGTFPVWNGGFDYIGGYDSLYSAPYDKLAIDPAVNVLYVHSSGNDGGLGNPVFDANGRHRHVADSDGSVLSSETFCYSIDGSGTDCPIPTCSAGISSKSTEDDGTPAPHCEKAKHPTYGPYNTLGFIGSAKNVLTVGATDSFGKLALFSSRGPTKDGRVKPELVAMGLDQFSTVPNGGYAFMSGTSMSSPVVAGTAALVAQQWKQTFNATATPEQIKVLLIAGARDQVGDASYDLPGPDYTYGFGLIDGQATIDLIRADANSGSHIRTASIGQGQSVTIPLTVTTAGKLRAVLGWADPEVLLPPATSDSDSLADKTLVNDLDLKILDASGNTTFPYVLDKNNPTAPATKGVNTVDNTEVVEIANAAPGNYRAVISGTSVPVNSPQTYVFVSTLATAGTTVCTDPFEPNDTPQTATPINAGLTLKASACTNDVDWYKFNTTRSGAITITVTTKDTPLTVQLNSPGPTLVSSATIPANSTATVTGTAGSGTQTWLVKVTPSGTVSGDNSYTLKADFPIPILGRIPGRRGH